jgi:hypothetical protein
MLLKPDSTSLLPAQSVLGTNEKFNRILVLQQYLDQLLY